MMCELIICLLVMAALIIYRWLIKDHNYWKNQGVPYLRQSFPFGNISDMILMKKTTGEVYRDIYRMFPNQLAGGFYKFNEPMLMIRDPELIRLVMIKEFSKFSNNDFNVSKDVDPLLAINPFVTTAPEWRNIRAIQLPAQSLSKIKSMVPEMVNCSNQMINYLKENINKPHEAKTVSGCYTGDTVAVCAFGLRSNSYSNDEPGFAAVTKGELFGSNYWDNFSILCAMLAPKIGKLLKLRVIHKEVEDYFVKVINAASDYRIKNGIKRNDFLQQLIDTNNNSENTKPVYNNIEMAGHCMTFYMDGYETTSLLLGFALYELAKHPEIQNEVREEIIQISKDINDFDVSSISSLTKLDNVVSETLRLHPPIQAVTRICSEDTTLECKGQKYHIRKGMSVVIPIYALHTDPENFPEPELFNPERFNKQNKPLIKKFTYIPYGEGPRICIGIRFALTQVKLAMIAILLKFRILLNEAQDGPIKLDPRNTFLHTPNGGLWLRFEDWDDL
ncbi:hypothetical protein O3M35_006068 [Rhynocoris fuscipes]|uniref:Cytochrome P450 n=1 Tax=Rhynocoris fuscipes TaxID=488301 RepID=A0AAW1DJ84_9HEMI